MKKAKKILVGALACICVGASVIGLAGCEGMPIPPILSSFDDSSQTDSSGDSSGLIVPNPDTPSEGLAYTLSDGEDYYIITGMGTCTDTNLVIPSTYEGKPVKEIASGAFCGAGAEDYFSEDEEFDLVTVEIESVYIPDSIMGAYRAFLYLDSLKSVTIEKCYYNESEAISEDEIYGYWECFEWCDNLERLEIKSGKIWGSFYNLHGLKEIVLGDGVTEICWKTFLYCESEDLTSIVLPSSLTHVTHDVFVGYIALQYVFYEGTELEWGEVHPYTEEQDVWTFSNAEMYYYSDSRPLEEGPYWRYVDEKPTIWTEFGEEPIPSLPIKDGHLEYRLSVDETYCIVVGMGKCTDTNLVIPSTYEGKPVKEIASGAFCGAGAEDYFSENEEFDLVTVEIESVYIPESVTCAQNAFLYLDSLKSVTVEKWNSNETTDSYYGLFIGCDNLERLEIQGGWIFDACYECHGLKTLILGDGVTWIGSKAFSGCENLESLILPSSLEYVGLDVFVSSEKLQRVFYEGTETKWNEIKETWWEEKYEDDEDSARSFHGAPIYYYSETQPAQEGNYWRYVDGQPVVWE